MKNLTHIKRSVDTDKTNFSSFSNTLIQNTSLSIEARGLIMYMLSLPKDWIINKEQIMNANNIGRDKFRRMWKELENAGYIISKRLKNQNGTFYWTYKISDKQLSIGGKSIGGKSIGGLSIDGLSTGGLSIDGLSTGGKSTGGKSTGGKPTDDQKTHVQKTHVQKTHVQKTHVQKIDDQKTHVQDTVPVQEIYEVASDEYISEKDLNIIKRMWNEFEDIATNTEIEHSVKLKKLKDITEDYSLIHYYYYTKKDKSSAKKWTEHIYSNILMEVAPQLDYTILDNIHTNFQ